MSALLGKLNRVLGTVRDRQESVLLLVRRHGALTQNPPVSLGILPEQVRGEVVAAAVPLALVGVDLNFHCVTPSAPFMTKIKELSILLVNNGSQGG
jgi:hypothetical protein